MFGVASASVAQMTSPVKSANRYYTPCGHFLRDGFGGEFGAGGPGGEGASRHHPDV